MAKRKTESASGAPIYVISGKEGYLVNRQCDELVESLLNPDERQGSLFVVDPSQVEIYQVLDELRTLPFLADKRVVVIKDAGGFISKYRQQLEKYFDNPSPTGVLIMTVESWMPRQKLAKKLPNVGKLISLEPPRKSDLPAWACDYARRQHKKKMDINAAGLLVELTGDEMARIASEIDKLDLYTAQADRITVKDIEALIGHNRLFNVFTVIDDVTAGNLPRALEKLRAMFAADRSAEYKAVGAFAFHFRRMFRAKVLLERGMHPRSIAGKLRIFGNEQAFFALLRQTSLQSIGSMLQHLGRLDFDIKTGRTNAPAALERLLFQMAGGN